MGRNVLPPARAGSWFNPELRTKDYDSPGDAYEDSKYNDLVAAKWNVRPDSEDKYLILVKRASQSKWIHLRLLADFMQIGRIPRDWVNSVIPDDRENRWGRANICILDYSKDNKPEGRYITNIKGRGLTTEELKKKLHIDAIKKPSFRLYVVEDLSRNVIEALGTKFGIDPDFFRAHIADYAWYNVRDRWRELQPLEVVRSQRNWFQIRYVTTRYCATKEKETGATKGGCFETALEEAKNFNILRRPDDDKSRGWWDSRDAVVALTRSRATFWHKPRDSENETSIGILLLDPTVSQGLPLWRGHRNFHRVPATFEDLERDMSTWETSTYDKRQTFFEDFIYWAQNPHVFSPPPGAPQEHLPVQTLLHLIGSEWLTMCDYIKTRLNQIDLETVDPVHFAEKQQVDVALEKLHMWRRFIPLYREMVSETLQHVFQFPCYAGLVSPGQARTGTTTPSTTARPPGASCPAQTTSYEKSSGQGHTSSTPGVDQEEAARARALASSASIQAYEQDFKLVLKYLEEYQMRIDRLTSVVTAVMAVDDTRRAINDARNIGRLTWLATFFIPFSVVAGIFSMQDLSGISLDTIRVYFATTIPFAIFTVAIAWALHSPAVHRWMRRMWYFRADAGL